MAAAPSELQVGQVSNSIAENFDELSLEIFDEAEPTDPTLFVDTLKAGWPVEKLSRGKFFSRRTLNLSDDEESISWVSLNKQELRYPSALEPAPEGSPLDTGRRAQRMRLAWPPPRDRAVTVYTIEDRDEFRMRDAFDALSFVKGIVSVIKSRDPRRHDIAKAKAEEEADYRRSKKQREGRSSLAGRTGVAGRAGGRCSQRKGQAQRNCAKAKAKAKAEQEALAQAHHRHVLQTQRVRRCRYPGQDAGVEKRR